MLNRQANLDGIFRALADPKRRSIVQRLRRAPATVTELAKHFSMSLGLAMHHVLSLEDNGLVSTEKHGRARICHVSPTALFMAERWLADQRPRRTSRLDLVPRKKKKG
jgi:DNA-binding transcriptional ArsR family regulator